MPIKSKNEVPQEERDRVNRSFEEDAERRKNQQGKLAKGPARDPEMPDQELLSKEEAKPGDKEQPTK